MIESPNPDLLECFEGLGDNCEFGFVTRKLGREHGSLLRWAFLQPAGILALLKRDFAGIFQLENIAPVQRDMVRDLDGLVAWHTQMYASLVDGRWRFDATGAELHQLHAAEVAKIAYLTRKFIARARAGGLIFVVKANAGLDPALLNAIDRELWRLCERSAYWLLEVRAATAPGQAGTIETRGHRLTGYVHWLAAYDAADDIDYASWNRVLAQALAWAHPTKTAAMPAAIRRHAVA